MDYKLVLDIIVCLLLVPTIGYAWVLNQKLMQLRKNRDEMARIVNAFNEATSRAEQGIPKLRRAADDAGVALQERVEKAQSLRDDLAFMIERADAIATRLETAARSARTEGSGKGGVIPPPDGKSAIAAAIAAASSAAGVSAGGGGLGLGNAAMAAVGGSVGAGGAGRGAARSAPAPAMAAPAAADNFDDDRSEAERELLRALQALR